MTPGLLLIVVLYIFLKFWFVQLITRTDGWTCMLCARYAGIGSVRLWPRKSRANYESCKRGDLCFITMCSFLLIYMTFKPVVVVTLHIILQIFPYSTTYFSNFSTIGGFCLFTSLFLIILLLQLLFVSGNCYL